MKDQAEVLGDTGWLDAVFNVQIASYGHVDPIFGGGDSIQKSRVVERAIPGDFESVECSDKHKTCYFKHLLV